MPIVVPGTGPSISTVAGTAGVSDLGVSTQIATKPGVFAVAVTETALPYTVDVSNYLSGTDSITSVVSTLILVSTGAVLTNTWRNSTTIVGNQIIINMDISKLQLGQVYQILVNFKASNIKSPTFTTILMVVT